MRLIMRSSKTGRKTSSITTDVANILVFNFCEQTFVQHSPITITIDCNGLSLLIFEEKWFNYGPKSAPNSESFFVRRLFNVCVRVFSALSAKILLVYIPTKIKLSFIRYHHDFQSNVAIFPSVFQAYTQPYSFGEKIKLII